MKPVAKPTRYCPNTSGGAIVDTLSVESPAGSATAAGTITNWKDQSYDFQVGSTVSLEAERNPDEVVFRVRDEGTGIPPELLERVFERFESRASGQGRKGVGLGLSIVRSFVELHGGTVTIESIPGRGTVVTCHFPTGPTASLGDDEIHLPRRASA